MVDTRFEKVKTKDELNDKLYDYYGFIDKRYIEYLESLLNLETSYLNHSMNDEVKRILSELKIFREIVKYNIYYGALKMVEDIPEVTIARDNEKRYEGLELEVESNRAFLFNYKQITYGVDIPVGYYSPYIGEINLYRSIVDNDLYDRESERLHLELEEEEKKTNPYAITGDSSSFNNSDTWEYEHSERMNRIVTKINNLKIPNMCSEAEYKAIEKSQELYKMFLKKYKLKEEDFVLDNSGSDVTYKRRIKKMPNLVIRDHTYYVI